MPPNINLRVLYMGAAETKPPTHRDFFPKCSPNMGVFIERILLLILFEPLFIVVLTFYLKLSIFLLFFMKINSLKIMSFIKITTRTNLKLNLKTKDEPNVGACS